MKYRVIEKECSLFFPQIKLGLWWFDFDTYCDPDIKISVFFENEKQAIKFIEDKLLTKKFIPKIIKEWNTKNDR
jgi:hypothetical protein